MKTMYDQPTSMPGGRYVFPWHREENEMTKKPKEFAAEDIVGMMTLPGMEEDSVDPKDIEQVVEARQAPEKPKEDPPKEKPVKAKEAPKKEPKPEPVQEPAEEEKSAETLFNEALDGVFDALTAFTTAARAWANEPKHNEAVEKLEQIKAVLED